MECYFTLTRIDGALCNKCYHEWLEFARGKKLFVRLAKGKTNMREWDRLMNFFIENETIRFIFR